MNFSMRTKINSTCWYDHALGEERVVIKQDGTEELLHDYMRNQPSLGNYEAVLQAHGGDKPHNEIKIEVSVSMAHVRLKGPKNINTMKP